MAETGHTRYGLRIQGGLAEVIRFELRMLRENRDKQIVALLKRRKGVYKDPPRSAHFKEICRLMFQDESLIQWNEWSDRQIRSLTDSEGVRTGDAIFRTVAWSGCATASKSYIASLYAFVWWQVDPANSIVILTSTTRGMVRKRLWSNIARFHELATRKTQMDLGHMIDSRTMIQAKEGSDDRAINCIAVGLGETAKAVANIQGQHAPRILLVIDEGTDTPEAICQCVINIRKSCQEFTVLIIGNPKSHFDPHGRLCEPTQGWDSIDSKTLEWTTKRVPEWDIDRGRCLRFAGWDSPNVKAGKTIFPFLYTWEDHCRKLDADQTSERQDNIFKWAHDEGLWMPEGACSTILTESMVTRYDLRGTFTFIGEVKNIAALDPAYGGDACMYVNGRLGMVEGGRMAIQIDRYEDIELDPNSKEEAEYQIARKVHAYNLMYGVRPACFGMDVTGNGRGAAAVLATEYGSGFHRVEFGGAATEEQASLDDTRPGKEVYDRRVTELHFHVQDVAVGSQIRGINTTAIIEFTARRFTKEKRKYVLETKDEVKAKLRRSPDTSDAIVILVEVARQNGLMPIGFGVGKNRAKSWLDATKKISSIYTDANTDRAKTSDPDDYALV